MPLIELPPQGKDVSLTLSLPEETANDVKLYARFLKAHCAKEDEIVDWINQGRGWDFKICMGVELPVDHAGCGVIRDENAIICSRVDCAIGIHG